MLSRQQDEEYNQLVKRTSQIQSDLAVVKQNAEEANAKLEEKTQILTAVRLSLFENFGKKYSFN